MGILIQAFLLLAPAVSNGKAIPVVGNGEKPAAPPQSLVLVEDLRLGPEAGARFIWSGANLGVQVDRLGRMYVLDGGENRVVVLAVDGGFLRQIGGTGRGPGEFEGLRSFQILGRGEAVAFASLQSAGAFSFFDAQMKFVSRKRFGMAGVRLRGASLSPDGRWIFGNTSHTESESGERVFRSLIMDEAFQTRALLLEHRQKPLDRGRMLDRAHWVEILTERLRVFAEGKSCYAAFTEDGKLYTAIADAYRITRWSADMEKELVITREYRPIPQTEADVAAIADPILEAVRSLLTGEARDLITPALIREVLRKADFPLVKNPIHGLRAGPGGGVLAIHDQNRDTGLECADLFDREGRFIGSFCHPHLGLGTMVFRGAFAYTIENVAEENYLVRYRWSMEAAQR